MEREGRETLAMEVKQTLALPSELWPLILGRLPMVSLARAACVCALWRSIAGDPAAVLASFKWLWKLKEVVGRPSCSSFWHGDLSQFVISHALQRWDTLESLAVKYDVQVTKIREINKMTSDYAVYSRKRLLIPVARPELLAGRTCFIEFDQHAQIELAVLYTHGRSSQQGTAFGEADATVQQTVKDMTSPTTSLEVFGSTTRVDEGIPMSFNTANLEDARIQLMLIREDMAFLKSSMHSLDISAPVDRGNFLQSALVINRRGEDERQEEGLSVQGRSDVCRVLTDDLWRMILERLPVPLLGRASCVCRLWRSIAGDPSVLAAAFMAPWKLREVEGRPASSSFWRGHLGQFVISHRLQRQDTMAGLAVKYRVQVPDIRRVNNMMSDHGIHSRERLLIPVVQPELLEGQTCFIELDVYAKREVAVLYMDGSRPDQMKAATLRANVKAQQRLKREVLESLKKSLRVDDSTAQYYLSLAEGDLRGALSHFHSDLRWEQRG